MGLPFLALGTCKLAACLLDGSSTWKEAPGETGRSNFCASSFQHKRLQVIHACQCLPMVWPVLDIHISSNLRPSILALPLKQ